MLLNFFEILLSQFICSTLDVDHIIKQIILNIVEKSHVQLF